VDALYASGTVVYAGGYFYEIGGAFRDYLAALDATTGQATSWNPAPGDAVLALTGAPGIIYAGGFFAAAGGQPRAHLAALDAASGHATPWTANADDVVYALATDGVTVFAGGYFRSVNQVARGSVAAIVELPTPTLVSLIDAQALADRVRLTWFAAAGASLRAMVQRRTTSTDWVTLGPVYADGIGRIAYEDRDVIAGARYGYRLGVIEGTMETFSAETWVDVPSAPEFSLAGARPNPVAHELAVAFSLPEAGPARLELYDFAGRRFATRDVGALGPGNHVVTIARGAELSPGVYVIRLTRGPRVLTARAEVIR
jgi:hypothetical protein